MSVWKMIGFWVVAVLALTVFFMTPLANSVSTEMIFGVLMAAAIAFMVLNYRKRT